MIDKQAGLPRVHWLILLQGLHQQTLSGMMVMLWKFLLYERHSMQIANDIVWQCLR
jgi:hypothetical protein